MVPNDQPSFLSCLFLVPEEVGASSDRVVVEVFGRLFAAVVLARISPDQVAHGPEGRGLFEAV